MHHHRLRLRDEASIRLDAERNHPHHQAHRPQDEARRILQDVARLRGAPRADALR